MALTNKTFSDLITFTRSGTATRVNSAGLIEDVAADTPRFDHDPVTGAAKGLLIEESRTNLLTDNADFTQSAWTKTSASINPNQVLAPDGTASADKLVEDATTNLHSVDQLFTSAATTQYTISAYVKAAGRNYAALRLGGAAFGGGTIRVAYDLTDGSTNVDSGTPDDYGAEDAGNGWYRIYLVATTTTGGATSPVIYAKDSLAGAISYSGDGSSGVYLWGAQLEAGGFATSLIKTPASFTSRASTATYFDSAGVMQTAAVNEARTGYKLINGTWTSMGLLLEAAATNLFLRSEEFDNASWSKTRASITADTVAAPDGATTADKLVEDSTASSTHFVDQVPSLAASTQYTMSVFAKAAERSWIRFVVTRDDATSSSAYFDISSGSVGDVNNTDSTSIEDFGGGWFRCVMTFTNASSGATANTARIRLATGNLAESYTGDGTSGAYIWGAQLEANSYATSYIPTTTATVTRSADVSSSSTVTRNADSASITGTAFSDWFNASEGTVFAEANAFGAPSGSSTVVSINSAANDRLSIRLVESGSALNGFSQDGGTVTATISSGTFQIGSSFRAAFAYKANDFAFCGNGGTVATDTSGTLPSPTQMIIGSEVASSNIFNGHIKNIKFYPSRLTDAELQALTT